MRIKHWTNYGYLDYKVIEDNEKRLVVEVNGFHRSGCACSIFTAKKWLYDTIKVNNNLTLFDMEVTIIDNGGYATYEFERINRVC